MFSCKKFKYYSEKKLTTRAICLGYLTSLNVIEMYHWFIGFWLSIWTETFNMKFWRAFRGGKVGVLAYPLSTLIFAFELTKNISPKRS